MAWRFLALAFGVAACYSPAVEDGLPCGPGNACPLGQSCDVDQRCRMHLMDAGIDDPGAVDAPDSSIIDAPPDGNPNLDFDMDGINDMADNCRTMSNMDQRDHDTDLIGDICDNCPHIANPTQAAMMDSDLVGDACDPMNGRTDTLARFDGFYGNTPPASWVLATGWAVGNGKLVGTAAGFTFSYLDVALPPNVTVVTAAAMSAPMSGTPNIGALAHTTPASSQYYRCGIVDATTGRSELGIHNGAMFTGFDQINYASPSFTDMTIRLDVTGSVLTCAARAGLETSNLAGTSTAAAGTRIGVRIREVTGSFDYVVVYTH